MFYLSELKRGVMTLLPYIVQELEKLGTFRFELWKDFLLSLWSRNRRTARKTERQLETWNKSQVG